MQLAVGTHILPGVADHGRHGGIDNDIVEPCRLVIPLSEFTIAIGALPVHRLNVVFDCFGVDRPQGFDLGIKSPKPLSGSIPSFWIAAACLSNTSLKNTDTA